MSVLDGIEKAEIRDLLGKGWLTHDGMWFYQAFLECGVETANALNKAAIKSMAPFEMQRAKRALGMSKERFDTLDELQGFMLGALELTLPESIFRKGGFRSPSNGRLQWAWENGECFAYKGMKQIGAIDKYRCGVMYRIECWLEALGVKYSIEPRIKGCLIHEKGACAGEIRVLLPE